MADGEEADGEEADGEADAAMTTVRVAVEPRRRSNSGARAIDADTADADADATGLQAALPARATCARIKALSLADPIAITGCDPRAASCMVAGDVDWDVCVLWRKEVDRLFFRL